MRKNQNSKTDKNSLENSQKNKRKNRGKNQPKNEYENIQKSVPKIRGNSRTMEGLKLPIKVQKQFRDNLIAINPDFMQYTCYNITDPLKNLRNIIGFTGEIDDDNSNIEYNKNKNLAMTRTNTKNGHAYSIFFYSPGFEPVMICSVEVYDIEKIHLLKTEGKIVFYGAYFVFSEILAEEAPELLTFHNSIELSTILKTQTVKDTNYKKVEKPLYKRTRIDIATDVAVPMSKKWLTSYIQPHKNSKHVPRPFAYDSVTDTFQSVGYIPRLKQGIGIRVYNKVKNVHDLKKQSWHPTYGTEEHPIVTRLEVVYSGDFAQNEINDLIEYTKYRLLGNQNIQLKTKIRPKSQYSPLSAYEYFKRYAKNHGKTLKEVLDDVTCIAMIEEQKDIEIFETNSKK